MIDVQRLRFAYPKQQPILDGWSGQVHRGEMIVVTGKSGCGKSTLLYLMGLMLSAGAGSQIVVDGVDAGKLRDHERAHLRAQKFGFVFQDAVLDATRSVIDNVTETALYRGENLKEARAKALQLLERFEVALRFESRPGEISGGQAQRVAMCRALLGDPSYIIADEPTGNLDPLNSQVVIDALRERSRAGVGVIVVSHDPLVVAAADREIQV